MHNTKIALLRTATFTFLWAVTLLLLSLTDLKAQEEEEFVNDPLKKPVLWNKLKEDPSSSKLWAEYLGKPWNSMNKAEKEQVSIWRQELLLQKISEREVVITSEREDENKPEKEKVMRTEEMRAEEIKNAESLIMQERDEITELKTNISENFVILEDLYRDAFSEFDVEYVSYDETHPNGTYPLPKWIEEQEAKLKKLKRKKLEELRANMGTDNK